MGRCFLACIMAYWFVHLLPGCWQITLAWERSRLVLYFGGSGLSLCPLGLGGYSSCEAHSRSYIVGFLLN